LPHGRCGTVEISTNEVDFCELIVGREVHGILRDDLGEEFRRAVVLAGLNEGLGEFFPNALEFGLEGEGFFVEFHGVLEAAAQGVKISRLREDFGVSGSEFLDALEEFGDSLFRLGRGLVTRAGDFANPQIGDRYEKIQILTVAALGALEERFDLLGLARGAVDFPEKFVGRLVLGIDVEGIKAVLLGEQGFLQMA
jgi:hypothetical protein